MKLKTTRSPVLGLDFSKFLSCYPYLSLLKKFQKATGEIKVLQPRHDDPKTEALEFKLVGDSFDNAIVDRTTSRTSLPGAEESPISFLWET